MPFVFERLILTEIIIHNKIVYIPNNINSNIHVLYTINSFSSSKDNIMEGTITIKPDDKDKKITMRNDDRTCEVEVKHNGLYNGYIETISSSGKYKIKLLEKIKDL